MPSHERIREVLESEETLERLAAIEHERWAHWQQYVHDQCEQREDGSLVVPADLAARWAAQIQTPYSALSDKERESDREQVRRYLPTVIKALTG
ncbi:hypothetical protein [Micrococcus luteus]|uniref:Uncharacterized protein n=1 Tax=Micrococcus luteus TaxID=1270 RepID=A0AAX0VL53_MICLU|nr:hypothetical protein [Micrococcus luteus]PKZ81994.1 hypothetical protein CYJ95_07270 [Micrococcus luteus]